MQIIQFKNGKWAVRRRFLGLFEWEYLSTNFPDLWVIGNVPRFDSEEDARKAMESTKTHIANKKATKTIIKRIRV